MNTGELAAQFAKQQAPPTDSVPDDRPNWFTIPELVRDAAYGRGLLPISTGFAALDYPLRGGFRPESTYVLAGRTGTAKSTLALNMARRIALDGHSVLVFKLEESPTEAVWRIHAAAAQVRLNVLLDGVARASVDDRARLADAWGIIRDLPMRLSSQRNLGAIQRIVAAHADDDGKLVIIDQLALVDVPGTDVGFIRATTVTNALRMLARDLHIPILIVSQVNRNAAKSKDPLTASDLRDSGCIENDAAAVILIDRTRKPDGPVYAGAEPIRYLQILVDKNRYGPRTEPEHPVELLWFPQRSRVDDVQMEVSA